MEPLEEGMKMDRQEIMALGEVLGVLGKYDVDARRVAKLLVELDDEQDQDEPQPRPKLKLEEPEGDRDEKGRRVVWRDRNWRQNTLKHLPPGEARTVGELVKAVGNVSHGAMVARVRVLENDGVIEEVQDGVGGLWRLK